MKQIGNLAVVCAKRPDLIMTVKGGRVCISMASEANRIIFCADWSDDAEINGVIHHLNFGRYRIERVKKQEG